VPSHPILYEINTRCWLRELSEKLGQPVTLANVPDSEFANWQRLGFTHIWLMGVWTTGPRSRAEALKHPDLRRVYDQVLPGWTEVDVGGSPYAIAAYEVPSALGGENGLKQFRERLRACGLKLLLDFVPNHLGLDHRWITERSELFVQRPEPIPDAFQQQTPSGLRWFAHGKDPYFPGWTDTVQIDYRLPATRDAITELLTSIADRCDGVRCDMAMLVLEDIFAKTWQHIPLSPKSPITSHQSPTTDFWTSAIPVVKKSHPDFLLLAEAYWGLEGRLQSLGFDFTYDKALYDKLVARDSAPLHLLHSPPPFVSASAHFLENHDEPRIASILSLPEHRAAALLILGSPGMRFLHEGQLTGARIKIPVQLLRRPQEPTQPDIQTFYEKILTTLSGSGVGQGSAAFLPPRAAWPDNPTERNFVLIQWTSASDPASFDLVAINLAPHPSQCYASLQVPNLSAHTWLMKDLLGTESYERSGPELETRGLYLDLPAHAAQLFRFTPLVS
jgi:glycosidase